MHGGVSGQLLRYVITGGAVTALQAAVYWVLAAQFAFHPQAANFIGYLAAVSSGYVLHGRFSFRGHGGRDRPVSRALQVGQTWQWWSMAGSVTAQAAPLCEISGAKSASSAVGLCGSMGDRLA